MTTSTMSPEEAPNQAEKAAPPSCLQNLSFYFTEYCDNTSIHGLKFVGERKRSILEKLWWLVFIGISFWFCGTLIWSTYQKWMNAPVLVSLASYETPIWDIPFPAVTICPLTTTEKSKFHFVDVLDKIETDSEVTEEEITQLKYFSLVCPRVREITANMSDASKVDEGAIKFLMDTSPNFSSIMYACKWRGMPCNHTTDFTPVLTSGGICYTFNMLDRNDIFTKEAALNYYQTNSAHQPPSQWTLQEGFDKEAPLKTFPRRTALIGTNGGLELTLYTSGEDTDYHCKDAAEGYKIILHHPAEMPRFHQRYFWVPLDQITSVDVNPNMMTTSRELRPYRSLDRKCYFSRERSLKFFKVYNQQNCLLECLTNATLRICGCVGFYMPRDESMPICGPAKMDCLRDANLNFLAREASFQMDNVKNPRKDEKKTKIECRCLPSCHALHYDPHSSQLTWNWRQSKLFNSSFDNETYHLSKVRIFFKNMQFLTLERNELYGQTEFWANCGGLLGLFTGFSFISLVEILYFATLRLFCNLRKFGRHYWSGAEELLEIKVQNS